MLTNPVTSRHAPGTRAVLGDAGFYGDVLATSGLDDRLTPGRVPKRAEDLTADAVHADHAIGGLMREPYAPRPRSPER